jgi:hypothetical protein
MTPALSGALMRRARKLVRSGRLTAKQFVVLDALVWSCRAPGADRLSVSYRRMMALAHAARSTVADAITALERLGLLSRIKRRVRVPWGGGIASRQATNVYVLHPPAQGPVSAPSYRGLEKKEACIEDALARLGAAMANRRGNPAGQLGKP